MSVRVPGQKPLPIPNHILDRMTVYRKYVDVADRKVNDLMISSEYVKTGCGNSIRVPSEYEVWRREDLASCFFGGIFFFFSILVVLCFTLFERIAFQVFIV